MNVIEIEPIDSWDLLKKSENSVLIDVRTIPEFSFVGTVSLDKLNKDVLLIPWRVYPDMKIDEKFNIKLTHILKGKFPNQENGNIALLFICRSGARSLEAASSMSKLNYKCYNVKNGFEGDLNKDSQRGKLNGWKANNLAWRQG